MILAGNLDAHLKILSDVCLQHSLQALDAVLHRQGAKIVHQPIRIEHVSMNDSSLDVVDVSVVLQCLKNSKPK